MDGKPPPKPKTAEPEHLSLDLNLSESPFPELSPAEITSRIKVDPWTGEVLPEGDPDQTSEVHVNPQTGEVLSTGRQVGPRIQLSEPGSGGELVHETTLEVDIRGYQKRLRGDEQTWPSLAQSQPTRDDGELPGVPHDHHGYPTDPSKQHAALIEGLSSTQAWPHMALGKSSENSRESLTLGIKTVLFIAIVSLSFGATLGSVATVLLIDRDDEPYRSNPTQVLGSSPETGEDSHIGSTDEGEDASLSPPIKTKLVKTANPNGSPLPPDTPLDRGLPNELVLPISFPDRSADPEVVDRTRIKQIAELMLQDRSMMVDIIGYASPDEPEKISEGLSGRRARIAAGLLGGYGPSRSRFKTMAGGVSEELPRKVVLRVRISPVGP